MKTQVLIVGAGPTGLLLAIELRRRDVDSLLIDELDAPRGWDRATVVHSRSMEIFEALGIADAFLAEGVKTRAARFESGGKVVGELDLELANGPYPFDLGLSEETTERILTRCLESLGGEVTRSTRLAGLAQTPNAVTATVERVGESSEVEAEWIVGCDGLHSVVREQSGITLEGRAVDAAWAVFDTTISGWDREYDVAAAFLEAPPVIMTPLPGRRWRVYMCPTSTESDLVAEASEVLHRYVPAAEFTEIENPARFHCHSRVAATYRSGRALLAGDAAHVCSPSEGHGMNTGLQDAFNLGWKLAHVCRGEAGERLLDTYEAERRPVAERIVASGADAEAGAALAESASRADRDAAMRQLYGDPDTSHREAAAAAELDRSYEGSPIVAGGPEGPLQAGRLLPETPAVELAQPIGHTILVIGGPGAEPDQVGDLTATLDMAHRESPIVEAVIGLTDGDLASQLGVDGVTVVAIRPDRYVGLRDDGPEPEALGRYIEALTG